MRLLRLSALLILMCLGCATNARYEEAIDGWMGSDAERLIHSWGAPSDTDTLGSGKVLYTWLYLGDTAVTPYYYSSFNVWLNTTPTLWCKTTFLASASGSIEGWRWEGNACRAR